MFGLDATSIAVIGVVGGIIYWWLFKRPGATTPKPPYVTGRPLLDEVVSLAVEALKQKGGYNPVMAAVITKFAKMVDQALDAAGVPDLDGNDPPPPEEPK